MGMFIVGVLALGISIFLIIMGVILLVASFRISRSARMKPEVSPKKHREPVSASVCGFIGSVLLSPLSVAALLLYEIGVEKRPNFHIYLMIAGAVIGTALLVAAAFIKKNEAKQMALRLTGIFVLIVTVSVFISIRYSASVYAVIGGIIAALLIFFPNFLTHQKKYQKVFRIIGMILILGSVYTFIRTEEMVDLQNAQNQGANTTAYSSVNPDDFQSIGNLLKNPELG